MSILEYIGLVGIIICAWLVSVGIWVGVVYLLPDRWEEKLRNWWLPKREDDE